LVCTHLLPFNLAEEMLVSFNVILRHCREIQL